MWRCIKRPVVVMSAEEDVRLKAGYKVDGRWQVVRKLGQGAFGAVYEAHDVQAKVKGPKALKLESTRCKDQVLKIEVAVLRAVQGSKHVCRMYAFGRNDKFNFLLMSLLGPSLSILRRRQKEQRFSMHTTTYILLQSLQSVKDMHDAGWLHRDVKPSNFCIGCTQDDQGRTIFVFDFGLSRCFQSADGSLRPARDRVGFRGTLRYCSINAHRGRDLGRQDDVVSLLYMMVEMVKGSLPWSKIDGIKEVGASKDQSNNLYDEMPPKLQAIHDKLYTLRYEDKPDYESFSDLLKEISEGKTLDLDWEKTAASQKTNTKTQDKKDQDESDKVVDIPGEDKDNKDEKEKVDDLPKSLYKESKQ